MFMVCTLKVQLSASAMPAACNWMEGMRPQATPAGQMLRRQPRPQPCGLEWLSQIWDPSASLSISLTTMLRRGGLMLGPSQPL